MQLRCGSHTLALDRVAVMGVLNVTPDSFSDGGLWLDADAAIKHGIAMSDEGTAIIDVGGESTRPGAEPVPEAEELRRVLPVIEALAEGVAVPISIDTRKPEVARRAIEAGATILNDTLGEESTGEMEAIAAATGVAICVMHSRGTPDTMRSLASYDDVVADVRDFLARRAGELRDAGIASDAIVIDPGFGFAKTPEQNLTMLRRFEEFVELGYPVLAGTSRKSFIGDVLDLPVDERVEGTAATVAWAVMKGARIVRVHDVEPLVRIVRMTEAIMGARD